LKAGQLVSPQVVYVFGTTVRTTATATTTLIIILVMMMTVIIENVQIEHFK
jgi:hypothetical protein